MLLHRVFTTAPCYRYLLSRLVLLVAISSLFLLPGCDQLTEAQREAEKASGSVVLPVENVSGISRIRGADSPITGRYIVQLMQRTKSEPTNEVIDRLTNRYGGQVDSTFVNVMHGFTIAMNAKQAELLASNPDVKSVEQDQYIYAAEPELTKVKKLSGTPWSLRRLAKGSETYTPEYPGNGVNIYVLGTGFDSLNAEVVDRLGRGNNVGHVNDWLASITGKSEPGWWNKLLDRFEQPVAAEDTEDCHGFGTRMASIAAGQTLGAAPRATIRPLKVMGCDGRGSISSVLQAVEWLIHRYQRPAVALFPFAAPQSKAIDAAARELIRKDIMVVAAAGDKAADACSYSPARMLSVVTVGGFTSASQRDKAVNQGTCVKVAMPSVNIPSRGLGGDVQITGGSAAAAAYAAGIVAQLREEFGVADTREVTNTLTDRLQNIAADGEPVMSYSVPMK